MTAGTHDLETEFGRIEGVYVYGALGSALENVGDLNEGGFPDLAMGAPQASVQVTLTGIAYVLFGGGQPVLSLSRQNWLFLRGRARLFADPKCCV